MLNVYCKTSGGTSSGNILACSANRVNEDKGPLFFLFEPNSQIPDGITCMTSFDLYKSHWKKTVSEDKRRGVRGWRQMKWHGNWSRNLPAPSQRGPSLPAAESVALFYGCRATAALPLHCFSDNFGMFLFFMLRDSIELPNVFSRVPVSFKEAPMQWIDTYEKWLKQEGIPTSHLPLFYWEVKIQVQVLSKSQTSGWEMSVSRAAWSSKGDVDSSDTSEQFKCWCRSLLYRSVNKRNQSNQTKSRRSWRQQCVDVLECAFKWAKTSFNGVRRLLFPWALHSSHTYISIDKWRWHSCYTPWFTAFTIFYTGA